MDSTWYIFDGIVILMIVLFAVVTAKRGLIKGLVSTIGFILSAIIATTVSGTISGALYNTVVRTSTIKEINKDLNDDTLVDCLAYHLENSAYNISVNEKKLREILEGSDVKSYDKEIYSFMNNINAKKVDDEESFMENLHIAYSNVLRDIIKKTKNTYNIEYAAKKVIEKPSLFTECFPLLLEKEDQRPAAVYICDTLLAEPYNESFRLMALIALFGTLIILSLIFTQAAGRNDKMEPGMGKHIFCGFMGIIKGLVVVFGIAVILRISIVTGSNTEVMFEHSDIDNTYAFKYVYNFVCGLK